MEAIQMELLNLLAVVLVACVGFITRKVTHFLEAKGVVARLESNKELVRIVVEAVEQVYGQLDGKRKLDIAKEKLAELMQEKNIKISTKEIDALIEALIKEMNDNIRKELN